jgi:hypothetical protein
VEFDHPPSSSARVKERVELYLYSPSEPSWPRSRENFIFTLPANVPISILDVYSKIYSKHYKINSSIFSIIP